MRAWLATRRPSWRVVGGVVGGAVVLAVLGVGFWFWSAAEQSRAMTAYAEALSRVPDARARQAEPQARAAAARELEAVLAKHPSAALAPTAAWELGHLRYEARDWPRARAAYEMALTRASSATLRTLAQAAIGSTWEAEGNYARAMEVYRAALAGLRPNEFLYEELLVDVARMQELTGQTAEAVATYRQFLKEQPHSPRAAEVKGRLAHLGAGPR
ncbi:MAG TPA: tetratricopeptide repeat protein [Methylomirabilota bacterium]|jgi:tetratricopeptide (TPR) repeat protein|nr:tetratricopeptide repeat protein [Methylomirabilota bacterium]